MCAFDTPCSQTDPEWQHSSNTTCLRLADVVFISSGLEHYPLCLRGGAHILDVGAGRLGPQASRSGSNRRCAIGPRDAISQQSPMHHLRVGRCNRNKDKASTMHHRTRTQSCAHRKAEKLQNKAVLCCRVIPFQHVSRLNDSENRKEIFHSFR